MATKEQRARRERDAYHHGNLREALILAALDMIAERGLAGLAVAELARAVGVSPAAPYRHFRDRGALLAEVARRGFEQMGAEMEAAWSSGQPDPVGAVERCAQAHLLFAEREPAAYAAMFEPGMADGYPDTLRAQDAAFAMLRRAADAACAAGRAPGRTAGRPPPMMVALHVWSLTHGIAALYSARPGAAPRLPMLPRDLLEAGLLVYLAQLGLPVARG